MKADLIITTYNRPDALEAVLVSVIGQLVMPHRVIIADDGSQQKTKDLVERYQKFFPVTLVHSWREDDGFRAAEARNRALALVQSEYVILIDGDMILEKSFVRDHLNYAKEGYFLQGGRIMLTKEKTQDVLKDPSLRFTAKIREKGLEARIEKRLTAFRSVFLATLFTKKLKNKDKIRSCNMSFFYNDVVSVNGFNNDFVGWGREDSEFIERMFNLGVKGKLLKFVALAYHLYHPEEGRNSLPKNDQILRDTIANKLIFCKNGLSQFLTS